MAKQMAWNIPTPFFLLLEKIHLKLNGFRIWDGELLNFFQKVVDFLENSE